MNCKWAEGHLSASLDGMLDPTVRDEVVAHVESCAHCGSILDEYRYFDGLVASLPRHEPSADLRQRIFGSPEFDEIVHNLETAGAARGSIISRPVVSISPSVTDVDDPPAGHDRPLEPLSIGSVSSTDRQPVAPSLAPDAERVSRRERGGAPPWARIGLSAAAAIVLVFGSTLLIRQGFSTTTKHGGQSIGPVSQLPSGQVPLSAGARVVFERNGALWSAPEHGAGVAQLLTPAGVVVGAGWSVTPLTNGSGGDSIAYIDLKTGSIHVVRADDQRDHVVGHRVAPTSVISTTYWSMAEGRSILGGLTWSPDGTQLAYLADFAGTGRPTLNIVHADGGSDAAVPFTPGASSSLAAWSADGLRVAFVETTTFGQVISDYNVASRAIRQISDSAEPGGNPSATVVRLGWVSSGTAPTLTWASGDAASGSVSGLFSMRVLQDSAPHPLVPLGSTYTASDYSPMHNGGTWLLGDGAAVYAVSAVVTGRAQLLAVAAGVHAVSWAPSGSVAAFIGNDGSLWLWTRGSVPQVATGLTGIASIGWSADGSSLAYLVGGHVTTIRIANGIAATPSTLGLSGATALAWAPDGQTLAVSTPSGVTLTSADAVTSVSVDTHPADGALIWSEAR